MRINKQEFQMVELDGVTDRLKEHPRNPNRGNVAAIHESINVNGFFGAILAQTSTGYILAGNHTFRTAVQQKAEAVPVLWIDVDDEVALRILLADNKIAELGYMDEAALDAVLESLESLEGTGFGLSAAQAQLESDAPDTGGGDFHLHADDIPDDSYEAQFGVVVMCEDGDHQKAVYEALQALSEGTIELGRTQGRRHLPEEHAFRRITLRLVAV